MTLIDLINEISNDCVRKIFRFLSPATYYTFCDSFIEAGKIFRRHYFRRRFVKNQFELFPDVIVKIIFFGSGDGIREISKWFVYFRIRINYLGDLI